jgi:hypothetical protein
MPARSITRKFLQQKKTAAPERRKLSGKPERWRELDFPTFRAEAEEAFWRDFPVTDHGKGEGVSYAAETRRLTGEIAKAEREIDAAVWALFDPAPDEIALLESSLEGPYSFFFGDRLGRSEPVCEGAARSAAPKPQGK